MSEVRVMVAGGGTAGHIEPALAVADALRDRGAYVCALGSPKGLEKDIVPARGYDLDLIPPVPVPRKLNMALLRLPKGVWQAVSQAKKIMRERRVDAVIGFGGYVSAPAYLAARQLGLPFFVHESNARAGVANKLGVRLGGVGLNAVSGSGMPGDVVGIPLRKTLTSGEDPRVLAGRARARWGLSSSMKTVVVTGGSQGAASINRAIDGAVEDLVALGFQVLHAYGKNNSSPQPRKGYFPVAYIDAMAEALAVADVTVCRSGAMTVAEVTQAGVPAIYVPLPHGNGEQALNARGVVNAGGAVMIDDADLSAQAIVDAVSAMADPERYEVARAAVASCCSDDAAGEIAARVLASVKR